MFNGITPKTFLDTPQEWHASVIGFFEALCPWPPQYYLTEAEKFQLRKEYHYYMSGRGLGFVALLFLLLSIVKFILEVIL